jgi:hypothetical protein
MSIAMGLVGLPAGTAVGHQQGHQRGQQWCWRGRWHGNFGHGGAQCAVRRDGQQRACGRAAKVVKGVGVGLAWGFKAVHGH